jgi:hypothetical protein
MTQLRQSLRGEWFIARHHVLRLIFAINISAGVGVIATRKTTVSQLILVVETSGCWRRSASVPFQRSEQRQAANR